MSIFDKSAVKAPARTVGTISKEREKNRARVAELSAKRDGLTAARSALKKDGIEPSPSDLWKMEEIDGALRSVLLEIEKAERFDKALAWDLRELELPSAREAAERAIARADQAAAELDKAIRDARSLLNRLVNVLALFGEANEAHEKVERISGEIFVQPRCLLDRQTAAVLRALYAFGAEGQEWHSRMFERGKENPQLWIL